MSRPDIFELAKLAAGLGVHPAMSPSVTPNLDPAAFRRMREAGVRAVSISLDGALAATHEGVRGITGHFEATVEAIRAAVVAGHRVQVNTTVMRENLEQLPEVAALLRGLGAHIWEVFFLVNTGTTAHDLVVKDSSGVVVAKSKLVQNGDSTTFDVSSLAAGSYTILCDVAGHEESGMKGTLKAS